MSAAWDPSKLWSTWGLLHAWETGHTVLAVLDEPATCQGCGATDPSATLKKGSTAMTTRKQVLQAQIRALAAEVAAIDDRPKEPFDPYAVVSFVIQHTADAVCPYHYAARKEGGNWSITGQHRRHFSWDELLDWIDSTNRSGGLAGSNLAVLKADRVLV